MPETRKLTVGVLLSGREKFSPYYGGALARWTYEVYSRLTQQFDATVLGFPTRREDLYPFAFQTSGYSHVCKLLAHIPRVRRYEDRLWLRALKSKLFQLDVLHIHNRPQWIANLRQLGYGGKLVLHIHNDHLGHWTAPMLDVLAKKVDAVATCSSYLRDTFALRSPSLAAKTRVVFNGANMELFRPCEELREPKTIFFVGRFDQEKGVLELIKAYARVLHTHPDAKLVIGGATNFGAHKKTPYVQHVREVADSIATTHGVQVQFAGYIDHDRDLPEYFQRATIFASPSMFQEPFGLVNVEAMSCATPVVGSNRGGIPEVLGDAGCVVDPEDIERFSAILSSLLSQPEHCLQLGRAGYERCRHMFDWQIIAGQWRELLLQIVATGSISN